MPLTRDHIEDIKGIFKQSISEYFSDGEFLAYIWEKLVPKIESRFDDLFTRYEVRIQQLEKDVACLRSDNDRMEQYSRRANIRIHGVKEVPNENVEEVVINVLKEKMKLNIDSDAVDRCHRLGPNSQKNRTIIVKFARYNFKKMVVSGRRELKGTKIVITEDLTKKRHEVLRRVWKEFGTRDTWTVDGVIYHRDSGNNKLRFETLEDVEKKKSG